ncbi:Uncharacterized protein PBTT_10135 [Plasmodiophora brassicae]|uniref:Uncharacterized protein n=1 Tax=Plasmodiophora brassicae TaxID=37360 RepID=A0A0G4INK9_PLABS|nr:hypothetical protein PBRA_005502 [Plasmodiophora brassicae]SPR01854.1 unnamed protein product [Plasmodiophora brassicae]
MSSTKFVVAFALMFIAVAYAAKEVKTVPVASAPGAMDRAKTVLSNTKDRVKNAVVGAKNYLVNEPAGKKIVKGVGAAAVVGGLGVAAVVAGADKIREKVGENRFTNGLVDAKNKVMGNKNDDKKEELKKTVKSSASSVAVGATAFAAAAFAVLA